MPFDFLLQAYEIFVDLAKPAADLQRSKPQTFDVLEEGRLDAEGFAGVLCKLTNVEGPEKLPDNLLYSTFYSADSDQSHELDFLEFALWYARHGFSENVLLTQEQREIRQIARKHGLNVVEVEEYRNAFNSFDEDGSGQIEFEEFQDLLNALIKVPANLTLPMTRVKQFWGETATVGSSAIGFEEFLLFYMRYFASSSKGGKSTKASPLTEFYRALRPVPVPRAW